MVMTDPIADMLTRIRNANSVHHDKVEIPGSKIKEAIATILKDEGFIKDFEVIEDNKQNVIKVSLKYGANREKVISGLKRIPIKRPAKLVWAAKFWHTFGNTKKEVPFKCLELVKNRLLFPLA